MQYDELVFKTARWLVGGHIMLDLKSSLVGHVRFLGWLSSSCVLVLDLGLVIILGSDK